MIKSIYEEDVKYNVGLSSINLNIIELEIYQKKFCMY